MLVSSRKVDESILIGGDGLPVIEVVIVEIRGDKVRLGIQAPPEIPVYRKEVYEAIQCEVARNAIPDGPKSTDGATSDRKSGSAGHGG